MATSVDHHPHPGTGGPGQGDRWGARNIILRAAPIAAGSPGYIRTVRYNPWRVEQRDEEDHTVSGAHFDTPGVTHLDAQGRPYRSDAYLRAASSPFEADGTTPFDPDTSPDVLRTTVLYDVQGNPISVVDPRGNTIQVQVFDLVGRPLFTGAADEGYTPSNGQGEARVLADAAGQPVHLWRSGNTAGITNERKTSQAYDPVRRPTVQTLTDGTATPRVTELRSYGELSGAPTTGRLAGRLFRLFDTAGLMEVSAYDLRGTPITLRRQVLADLTSAADWSSVVSATTVSAQNTAAASLLNGRSWPLDRSYDALGRLLWEDAPDADSAGANRSRTTPSYDVGGRLVRVEATVRGATTATVFVSDIAYNARGQRESITYGEGATSSTTTSYTYDPQRLWLTRLRTVRAADSAILQDLQYSRDHVGNVIEIDDEAQQTHWFDNAQVSPERTYSYDPLYRLSSATGREKVGLAQAGVLPFPVELLPHGGAANTVLRRYTQSYVYDAAGNLTETVHVAGGGVAWRRRAQVAAGNNQVLASSSSLPGEDIDDPTTWFRQYSHDRRGNMLVLPGKGAPNGMVATRDHRDHLESVALNSADSAHYTYDGAGQRFATVVDKGQLRHTTLTLWGIEQTTKHNMAATPPALEEERGTLHIMDDQQRVALVETRTVTTTGTTTTVHGHAPAPLVRFQLGDLLASAYVELDGSFGVLSYPELHPSGTTAWRTEDGALEVSKRYRFTAMERDEETGLKVHNQRYTCPWLGRWDRPDPIGLGDGGNRWAYVKGRVTTGRDESGLEGKGSLADVDPST